MKNLVRAFVIALVLTGTIATVESAQAGTVVTSASAHALPKPTCPPSDPHACGLTAR